MFGKPLSRQKISRMTLLLLGLLLWWSSQVMSHPAPVTLAESDTSLLTTPMPVSANGQNRTQAKHLIALADVLKSDGTLPLSQGLHGSLDPTGWQMVTQQDGAPRFMPHQSPPLHELGGGQWDESFGSPGTSHLVRAIAVTANALYVAGDFTTAGGISANRIAQWDGSSWSPLGDGMNRTVYALAVDSNGILYAGGSFNTAGDITVGYIARWDGSNWSALGSGSGMNSTVYALAVDSNDTLYAGGHFTTAGGTTVNHIARWDGSNWSALGSGMNGSWIYVLAVDSNDTLYAGGHFTTAGGTSANYIARWDGSNWSALGNGSGMSNSVYALAVDSNDSLYAGGDFITADDTTVNRIARWDGSNWSALGNGSGMSSSIWGLAVDSNDTLYAGGNFATADGTTANHIARWDGSSWSALGSGMDHLVLALAVNSNDNLYAGGGFTTAGDQPSSYIARWIANITPTPTATNTPPPTPTPTPTPTDNPRASNVRINPTSLDTESNLFVVPQAGTEISVSYDYDDPNGDPEGETLIRWTRGSQLEQQVQPQLNQEQTVPSGMTLAEERWCVIVTPHDGQFYGQPVEACAYIERIPNQVPEVEVTIPEYPRNDEPLTMSYKITDPDNQRQNLTAQLRWYRDGILQPTLNNQESVDEELIYIAEEWCAVAQAYDGEDYGPIAESNCTIINPPDNILPVAQNASIIPVAPTDSDDLTISYYYLDPDHDAEEGQTQIRWYRNNLLQPRFNDKKSVEADLTEAGERWWATVRAHDGLGYGRYFKTKAVYISADMINTLPEAFDVQITPVEPSNDDPLRLRYTFEDPDHNQEGDTIIRWYKDMVHIKQYDGLTLISADETSAGQIWHAVVFPHDGQDYGPYVVADSVSISETLSNVAPEALDVYLSPNKPGDDQNLVLHYEYRDENGDLENDTLIRWLVNGIPQPTYDDQSIIPAEKTNGSQTWRAFVTPYDGQDYGEQVGSNSVQLQEKPENTAPVASAPYLMPSPPTSSDKIELKYSYFDADGDSQRDTIIKWFKNGIQQEQLNDQTVVAESATLPDDVWYATVRPHDGETFGEEVSTPLITINTAPEVLKASIMPQEATSQQDLALTYDYSDHNNDPEGVPKIEWFRNGSHQPDYDDKFMIRHEDISDGDRWQASIWAFDGYEYSNKLRTAEVQIDWRLYLPAILSQKMDTPPTATPTATFTPTPTPTPPMPAGPYEENNAQETAYGPLVSGGEYEAYPEDKYDWYYIVLNERSSIKVDVTNYTPNDNETEKAEGQVAVYQVYFDTDNQPQRKPLANDGRGGSTMVIPNDDFPIELNDLPPGRYLILIYTDDQYNESDFYRLEVRYE